MNRECYVDAATSILGTLPPQSMVQARQTLEYTEYFNAERQVRGSPQPHRLPDRSQVAKNVPPASTL